MFEDEHRESTKRPTRLDYVMSDAALLLPPAATPLTGIDFAKRLPCGEVGGWPKPILITLSVQLAKGCENARGWAKPRG